MFAPLGTYRRISSHLIPMLFLVFVSLVAVSSANGSALDPSSTPLTNCYVPIDGGWRILLPENSAGAEIDPSSRIGVPIDDARQHRRPLFPIADRSSIWTEEQLTTIERCAFRPLVVTYNEPRFILDYHSAGGFLGHLYLGLKGEDDGKWLHQWSNLDVSYVDGRMDYVLSDAAFPGTTVFLSVTTLAQSAGLIVKVVVEGGEKLLLVWAYGGASAFSTNYHMTAPPFRFAPEHCAKDRISRLGRRFTLRRTFDKSDAYTHESFAATKFLPDWEAVVQGGGSWDSPVASGDPIAFAASPGALIKSGSWANEEKAEHNKVAFQVVKVDEKNARGYLAIGMGGNIAQCIEDPRQAWFDALARNRSIAGRIVIKTPDPHLDAAMRMMAFSTEGTWGDLSILHGAWSWRMAFLGWRGWYGSMCYGWTDRIRQSIENHTRLSLVREGPDAGGLGALIEHHGIDYNMNEVFLDQVRQYFDYTNDLELMRTLFPVLKGILEWENRRLQPESAYLYESALNTWISDSHWYIRGQCSQASAYMLQAHTFVAELAERLGEDPAPWRTRAERIREAMQEKLWMPEKGVFAEYLDTRGYRMLHPEPELPTIYHTAEFGAADAEQIAQMLRWADANLKTEHTPGGGKLVWSSNWAPNHARSYTHSTYELAFAEELNFALTNYLAGRADEAYALIRASLCGVFSGPTPGGLPCHTTIDGRQRANDEFADAISMWSRTVVEGLFGIVPKRPDGLVILTPQFPKDWTQASITSPAFSYEWLREGQKVSVQWSSPVETAVRLRLPIPSLQFDEVRIDGKQVEATVEPGFSGVHWLTVLTPTGRSGSITARYPKGLAKPIVRPAQKIVSEGQRAPYTHPKVKANDLAAWDLIDVRGHFTASVAEVMQHVADHAVPPELPASQVGFKYWRDHVEVETRVRNKPIADAAWRAKVGEDGVTWTTDGIPFLSAKEGPNIAVVTREGAGFPTEVEIPVNAQGATLYLMLSGITYPVQSHVVNLRVTLKYGDGETQKFDLVNPFDIGDCWSTWAGHYHDTASNGFENIGGRSGPMGSSEVADLTQPIALDTEAHLVPFELRTDSTLASVSVEAIANDIIFGVMGATILKKTPSSSANEK